LLNSIATQSIAGGCLKDTRRIPLDKKNVAKLSDYLCRSEADPQTRVRVQFQRLRGLAPGVLLSGGSAPWVSAFYGKYRVVGNEIQQEYQNLITRFGSPVRNKDEGGGESIALTMAVGTPKQFAKFEALQAGTRKGAEIRSFTLPTFPDFALVDETIHSLYESTWPTSLSMNYSKSLNARQPKSTPIDEMTLWRYITPDDLNAYSSQLQRYNGLVEDPSYSKRKLVPKSVQLLQYLTANGWPEYFLYSSATVSKDEPCELLDFRTIDYRLAVDIAVIENVSSRAINIERLFGEGDGSAQLRAMTSTARQASAEGPLSAPSLTLEPGEKVVVPLRLLFTVDEHWLDASPDDLRKQSRAAFARIQAAPAGTVFETRVFTALRGKTRTKDGSYVIRKVRESFKAPSYPASNEYAFGPAWTLKGIEISGERIALETAIPNFVEMTAANEAGSCPILYVWGDDDGDWIRFGKVIHKAQGRDQMLSETIEFSGLAYRFRIVEEELERAVIDAIHLQVHLADGRTLKLIPTQPQLRSVDGSVVELFAMDDISIAFALPDDLLPSQVVRSAVTITGYYDRYPAMLVSRRQGGQRP
jgi:hypothetical protein